MRIVKKTYTVSGPSGTSLITTFQVKGFRPRKVVKVPARKSGGR